MREVGALLDAREVHGGRTAYHHLLALAQSNGMAKSRVNEVLELVGLEKAARQRVKGFSLGMAQRLGIAAAMLGDPPVLLFDEPVNGLDPAGILWIRELMQSLAAEGRTVFVSSHLMSEMALTADHLVAEHHITIHELFQQAASLEEAFMEATRDSVEYEARASVGTGPRTGELV